MFEKITLSVYVCVFMFFHILDRNHDPVDIALGAGGIQHPCHATCMLHVCYIRCYMLQSTGPLFFRVLDVKSDPVDIASGTGGIQHPCHPTCYMTCYIQCYIPCYINATCHPTSCSFSIIKEFRLMQNTDPPRKEAVEEAEEVWLHVAPERTDRPSSEVSDGRYELIGSDGCSGAQ